MSVNEKLSFPPFYVGKTQCAHTRWPEKHFICMGNRTLQVETRRENYSFKRKAQAKVIQRKSTVNVYMNVCGGEGEHMLLGFPEGHQVAFTLENSSGLKGRSLDLSALQAHNPDSKEMRVWRAFPFGGVTSYQSLGFLFLPLSSPPFRVLIIFLPWKNWILILLPWDCH